MNSILYFPCQGVSLGSANEVLSEVWSWPSSCAEMNTFILLRDTFRVSTSNCAPLVAGDCFQPTILINRTCQFCPIFVFVARTCTPNLSWLQQFVLFPNFTLFLSHIFIICSYKTL